MSHTPGPWYAAAREGDDFDSVVAVDSVHEVCQCFHRDLTLRGMEECEANARLIAAAPDMAEALEHMLNAVDAFWPKDEALNEMEANEDRVIARVRREARAAIAKAEGKEVGK